MRLPMALLLAARAALAAPPEEFVPGHVVVRWRSVAVAVAGARLERRLDERTHLLRAADASAAATGALVARLAALPGVEWAEREHVRRRSDTVVANDPLFQQQWALDLARIPAAWSRTEGSPTVVVAVVDSGIRPHPDLETRTLPGYDMVSDPISAGDGDGRDADPTDEGTPDDASSGLHGLHVAGILGAHTDNALGIAGVDWNCRLLPVRVLGVQGGRGTDSDIADGIRWAAGIPVDGVPPNPTPAQVINLSFGGPGLSALLQAAVDDASSVGAIIVAAAGNDGADTATYAPAALTHVIAVGAATDTGALASYSNVGSRVDLLAPGGDVTTGLQHGILSTLWVTGEGYTYVALNGTSQAAPHVSGVASLMKALDPNLTSDAARSILVSTADPVHRCEAGCGGGLLDADAAVAAVALTCNDGHCAWIGHSVIGGCAIGGRPARGFGSAALLAASLLVIVLHRRRRAV